MSDGSRVFRTKNNQITQAYKGKSHIGIDLVGYYNALDDIIAHSDGVVVSVRNNYNRTDTTGSSYGNYVEIRHDNQMFTLYAHLKYGSVNVKIGDRVAKGQVIGYMGNTGHSFGAHLHFEVRDVNGNTIDPTPYINADLPNTTDKPNVIYQAYDNVAKRFWSKIVNYNNVNYNGYAGYLGHNMGGLRVQMSNGAKVYIKAHLKGGNWLSEITKWDDNWDGYSGLYGNSIDAFMIKCSDHPIKYRVHTRKHGWLSWVTGYDEKEPYNGYAGLIGDEIDLIQIGIR